jgi:37-kD nucleoid-associated bacterial protein
MLSIPHICSMTGIDSIQLQQVIAHKVGNPTRGEDLKLSENPLTLNDKDVQKLLNKFFLGPFNEQEQYHFTHISNLEMNEVFSYASAIFADHKTFAEQSNLIAKFLYSKSTHVRVKEGEMYVALFDEVPLNGEYLPAIGIFKSETKETFLKVFPHGQSLEIAQEEGININKLDKGCLIFKTNKAEGYVVCIVDHTNKQNDTQYWVTDFLQVIPYADAYHNTSDALQMCRLFVTNEYSEKFDVAKSDQIDLMNRSLDYFKTKDHFNMDEFKEEVIHHPEVADSFSKFKENYEANKEVDIQDDFAIHIAAVKKQSKVFKNILKLDKNFHVYIHGRQDMIEKGIDERTGKKFYKLYFDEES